MKAVEYAAKALRGPASSVDELPSAARQTGLDGDDLDTVRLELTKEYRRLTTEESDALIADYEAGVGVVELGRKYRVHRATVWRHLRERANN